MSPAFLLLILPMAAVALACRYWFAQTITWAEAAAQAFIGAVVVAIVWAVSINSMTADVETLNGYVTSKSRDRVSCSHSYPCNCRQVCSGSGSSRSCSTHCDTCHEHLYDVDWNVASTVGGFTIDRIDRRGLGQPERWTRVAAGQPVAMGHGYTNWMKGAPDSLFHAIGTYKGKLPDYPGFYDYQFSDRVLGAPRDAALWNANLANSLRQLGAAKQVNFVLVITKEGPTFAEALRSKWIGGKKNDIVIVVGSRTYPQIDWVRVFSWSKVDIVNVAMREDLLASKTLDPHRTVAIIAGNAQRFYQRRPMADFDYLKDDVKPSAWVMVLALILGSLASIVAACCFHHNGVRP